MNKEIEIPKGYEARIEGNKVVFISKESEDERIRKEITECIETLLKAPGASPRLCDWLAYLEKQKEPQELPLMNGDADLYFDNWNQHNDSSKRGCFNEGIRYAQRLQKEQKCY